MYKQKQQLLIVGMLITSILVFAACGGSPVQTTPISTSQNVSVAQVGTLSSDQLTATLCSVATRQAGDYVMLYDLFGTPTPDPRWLSAVPTPTPAPVGTEIPGDANRGLIVFNTVGTCSACHKVMDDSTLVGPSLKGIASRAASRVAGLTAKDYLRTSILRPDEFLVPGMSPGIMPSTFEQTLDPQQIADVIAYLMTLD